jgi:uncharacterized protein
MLSDAEGTRAVHLARDSLRDALSGRAGAAARTAETEPSIPAFEERRGVFVTLRRHPSGDLRGCVGFPLPIHPLAVAIREAAISAATEDPRFPPVRAAELAGLAIEVSVLTVPVAVRSRQPAELLREIEVGRDGLIVDGYGTSGLLLPQVAHEQGWGSEEFLEGTCEKAGLPPDAWKDLRVRVRRFEAEVFAEKFPEGPVVREAP